MSNFNSVILEGNLVKDPELRYTAGGTAICTFPIGVNRSFKKGDEWQDEASFFDVQTWGKMAERATNTTFKGKKVVVTGYLKQERWETDGHKRSKVVVVAREVFPVERSDG
jgi:single-strand DNA-binding protein